MGFFDSIKRFFGGAPAAPVEAPLPNTEPAIAPFPPNAEMEDAIAKGSASAWQVYADWLMEQGVSWGEVISAALQGNPNELRQGNAARALFGRYSANVVWQRGVIDALDFQPTEELGEPMHAVLERVLKHPAGHFVRKLTLGLPPGDDMEWHMENLVKAMASAGPLPCLEELDLSPRSAHMDQVSWRRVGDIRGLWKAAPNLKVLKLQGSSGSGAEGVSCLLAPIDAPRLEHFVYESGGLDEAVPLELGATRLPSLVHLELWLGVPDYGCSTTIASLAGVLGGAGLPSLKSLALKNSEAEAELIEALAESSLLPRLERLDLSMGVMSTPTTGALRRHADRFKHLLELDLNDNYFSEADQRALLEVLPMAKFGTQKTEEDPDARYTSVGE